MNPERKIDDSVALTGAALMKKLRDFVQPKGKRGTWLRVLSDKRLAEVYHRLKLGQAPYHITKIAQKEWNVMPKSETKSLTRALYTFQKKFVGEIQQVPDKTVADKAAKTAMKKKAVRCKEKLDGLGSLRWLIDVQAGRVESMVEREKTMNLTLAGTDKAVKNLGELLDNYVGKQIELGILDSKPSEFNVNIQHQFSGLLQESVQPGGVSMIEATNKFLESAETKCLTMSVNADGSYAITKPGGEAADVDGIEDTESE